MKNKVIKDRST